MMMPPLTDEQADGSNYERSTGGSVLTESSQKSVFDIIKNMEATLRKQGIPTARLDAEVIIGYYLNRDRVALYREGDYVPTFEELNSINQGLARRITGAPVAYIIGRKEFWSLEFEVNQSVLIPRPETELLVETVVKLVQRNRMSGMKILEIGTGSGAISVALASELKSGLFFAMDVSRAALAVARKNARQHGVSSRIFFFCGNLCEPLKDAFDFVISNPPYISEHDYEHLSTDVREFEPKAALIAGPEGTEFHRDIINGAVPCIRKGGWLVMEVGYGQREAVERMLRQSEKYDYIGTRCDYAGIDRIIMARRKE